MTQQERSGHGSVNHAALAALAQRIRARQERQEAWWRGPILPAAVEPAAPLKPMDEHR